MDIASFTAVIAAAKAAGPIGWILAIGWAGWGLSEAIGASKRTKATGVLSLLARKLKKTK